MDALQFTDGQKVNLVRTIEGAWAFVPPMLPPKVNIGEVAIQLAATAKQIGELKGAARRLTNPYMLIMPLIRREALTSSAMEGTITTIDDMLLQEVTPEAHRNDDAREVLNYIQALRQAIRQMETLPISGRLIRSGHKTLLSGLSPQRGAGKRPGEYKAMQNAIGDQSDTIFTARYVPPPPVQTEQCMAELEVFINRENRADGEELLDLAMAHYQFEAIHPFQDGNGRMGRMLITLMAIQFGLVNLPLLHVSAVLERRKPEYIERLFEVSTHGKWLEWIAFFLDTVSASCKMAIDKVDSTIALHSDLKQRATTAKRNYRLNSIIDSLFEKEWTTATEVARRCGVTFPTAQSDILALVQLEILRRIPNTRPAIFVAQPIWDLGKRD